MAKLQHKALNKGIDLESKLMEQLTEYDTKVIDVMTDELKSLEAEYEALQLIGNVRTEFNIEKYLDNQRRLKELPILISDLNRDRLKAIEDKSKLKDSICRGIYAEVGDEYRAEFNSNVETMVAEYDKALTKLIEVNKQMEALESEYKYGLQNVIATKGIYLSLNVQPFINEVMSEHNLNNKSLHLYYAK